MANAETLRSRIARKPIVGVPSVYDPFTVLGTVKAGFGTPEMVALGPHDERSAADKKPGAR